MSVLCRLARATKLSSFARNLQSQPVRFGGNNTCYGEIIEHPTNVKGYIPNIHYTDAVPDGDMGVDATLSKKKEVAFYLIAGGIVFGLCGYYELRSIAQLKFTRLGQMSSVPYTSAEIENLWSEIFVKSNIHDHSSSLKLNAELDAFMKKHNIPLVDSE